MEIDIPSNFWEPALAVMSLLAMIGGCFRFVVNLLISAKRSEAKRRDDMAKTSFEMIAALERRIWMVRQELSEQLNAANLKAASKEELAVLEQRVATALGELRDDVRGVGRDLRDHSSKVSEDVHSIGRDVAEIKGHLGQAPLEQEG